MKLSRLLAAAGLLAAAACADTPTSSGLRAPSGTPSRLTGPVTQVTITPSPVSVNAGSTVQLTARAYDANGAEVTGVTPTWSSNAPSKATVSSTGLVTGQSQGSATVFASVSGVVGSVSVTVNAPPPPLSVSVQGPQFIHTAGSYQWDATVSGGTGPYTYYWTLETAYTGPGTGQPTYWGSGSSVGEYVDSGYSPYLYWIVTVTSANGQTGSASAYVCNFTASAMC
ncbi:MAG TPA: Ig-like domain-containing protein [Longimicrobiaceae bacterium]